MLVFLAFTGLLQEDKWTNVCRVRHINLSIMCESFNIITLSSHILGVNQWEQKLQSGENIRPGVS